MAWIEGFFAPGPALVVSAGLLGALCLLYWRQAGRKIALAICILLTTRYMLWRGLYTLNLDDGLSLALSLTLFLAETYGFSQFLLFSYQAWSPTDRESPPVESHPSVDIMVTVVDEPLYILRRTLIGCLNQDYPEDRFRIYVCDDGGSDEARELAESLGVSYVTRTDRSHAKAGNLNHAMLHSSGELIAVFDVDHVPSPDFLKKTVGFFADEKVAIVQTAQGFYNRDIFQRSVGPARQLHNEQALFFRTLQAGRDAHGSAFFAGSSGLLRRSALEDIGGFQTETITEDLHTSLLLHAKGYESRYLNETLAFGLMPDSFEGHKKQRTRWATGSSQVLRCANPLFLRGLSWPQRLDYIGSIHYFFFGLPRIVFLAAPLSWLLLSVPALKADIVALASFFLPAYAASLLTIRAVSRNTRNAFWSDIHETILCFAMTRASLVGLFRRKRPRKFEVTPKGTRSQVGAFAGVSAMGWQIGLAGLLVAGLAQGVMRALGPAPPPGLSVSLGWGAFNLILLAASVIAAREQQQIRGFLRRQCRVPCWILEGSESVEAEILDVSESGAALGLPANRYFADKELRIAFDDGEGELLTLRCAVIRQEVDQEGGGATVGVQFQDPGERTTRALIARAFAPSGAPTEKTSASGVLDGLVSLLSVLSRWRERLHPSRRRTVRLPLMKPCRLLYEGMLLPGTTRDVSFGGVSAALAGHHDLPGRDAVLSIGDAVELGVILVGSEAKGGETLVRFRVETVAKGEETWRAWHRPSSH